jgi:hypothetical protein
MLRTVFGAPSKIVPVPVSPECVTPVPARSTVNVPDDPPAPVIAMIKRDGALFPALNIPVMVIICPNVGEGPETNAHVYVF